jgi:hypothetical protein
MKTYCGLFFDKEAKAHFYQYFNDILELDSYLQAHQEVVLLSLQRIFNTN